MGLKKNFMKGCAILLTSIAILTCMSACKDKTPVTNNETKYEVSASTLDSQVAYETLKAKLISAYSDLTEIENANWEDLSILYIHQDNDEFRDLCITAAVPLDDADYEYCLIDAQHNAKAYEYDTLTGFDNLGSLYLASNQNKDNTITYYSGNDFGAIAENFEEEDYTVTTTLVKDTYYTISDGIQNIILESCDDERLEKSNFFNGYSIESYLTYVDEKEVSIYNTETMEMVKLIYSQDFKSFQESHPYLVRGEYSTFTTDQLKALGYSFTTIDTLDITKKK